MKRFKNILFVADGIREPAGALDRAGELAETNEARLTVMDVAEPVAPCGFGTHSDYDFTSLVRDRRAEELAELTAPHVAKGRLIATQMAVGTPFIEIIRSVQRNGFDLVIKPAHAPVGPAARLFGSTDLHLLRKCPCPVWIDHPGPRKPYRTILAAVNPVGAGGPGLDRLILDLATSLADREDAVVHLVHAWRLEGEALLRSGRARIPERDLDIMLEDLRSADAGRLAELISSYGFEIGDPRVHLIKGDPATVIVEKAEALGADLLVMGTLARTGVAGLFIGNTAEEVIEQTARAVLAVKPQGFITPVC
jgi:universal stress protein E